MRLKNKPLIKELIGA